MNSVIIIFIFFSMADLILTKHFLIETEDEEEYGLDYKDANDSEITADSADYEEKNGEESEYDYTLTGTDNRVTDNTFIGTDNRVRDAFKKKKLRR